MEPSYPTNQYGQNSPIQAQRPDYVSGLAYDLAIATAISGDQAFVRDANGVMFRVQRLSEPNSTLSSSTSYSPSTPQDIPRQPTHKRMPGPSEPYNPIVNTTYNTTSFSTAHQRGEFPPQISPNNIFSGRQHAIHQLSDPRVGSGLASHAEYGYEFNLDPAPMRTYSQSSGSASSGISQCRQIAPDQYGHESSLAESLVPYQESSDQKYFGVYPTAAQLQPRQPYSNNQPQPDLPLQHQPTHIYEQSAPIMSYVPDQPGLESTPSDQWQRQRPSYSAEQYPSPVVQHDPEASLPERLPLNSSVLHTFSAAQLDTAQYPIVVEDRNHSISSGSPSVRDIVALGGKLIYESMQQSLMVTNILGADFQEANLRVFQNEMQKEIRVFMKMGSHTESHTMPEIKARLVPDYAYSTTGTNIISIYDNGDYNTTKNCTLTVRDPLTVAPPPLWLLKFLSTKQLLDFQSRITGEEVVLDISSIRSFRIHRRGSHDRETFSGGIRVQMWHESRLGRQTATSGASIFSNGTMLSAPLKERTTLRSAKLMVYLGRTESYYMSYITDDIELVHNSRDLCILKLRPRNYDLIHLTRSRSRIPGRIEERSGGRSASLKVLGHDINPDEQDSFSGFKSLTLEFENESNQMTFAARWEELLRARRLQRQELGRIQEEMSREGLNARDAMRIRI